jgi:PKD repeat protein
MKIFAPRPRARTAAFLSPLLLAAALLAPASALAVPPTFDPATPIVVTPAGPILAGTPVTFTTAPATDVEGGVISYDWTITPKAAPNTGSGTSVLATFPTHGQYTATVTATAAPDPNNLLSRTTTETSAPESATITVGNSAPVIATASASTTVPTAGLAVNFNATATDADVGDTVNPGDILKYFWSFGDGASATGASASHVYTELGVHTATLTVDDGNGLQAPPKTFRITVANHAPTATIGVSPDPVGIGKLVTFDGSGSSDPDPNTSLGFAWDLDGDGVFGDGGNSGIVTRTFTTPGVKSVSLRVDDGYATSTATKTFTVLSSQPPAPSFGYAPALPQVGGVVTFTSTSVNGESPIASLRWDLDGNGAFDDADGGSAQWAFGTPGPHTVSLQATDALGVVAVARMIVTVAPAPVGAPVVTPPEGAPVGASASSKVKAKSARLMSPFPKVRIRGVFFKTSVKLSFISVTARAGSTVKLKCAGHGCPKQKTETKKVPKGKRSVRFTKFPNALRKGATLRVYITRKGVIGKYTRFRIRVNKAPARLDACLPASGSTRPRKCPLPK